VPGQSETEECYQQGHLPFATETTEIRYHDNTNRSFLINATTTSVGTWPAGSMWRKNPIPMCNCDLGEGCSGSGSNGDVEKKKTSRGRLSSHGKKMVDGFRADVMKDEGKQCIAVSDVAQCGTTTGKNTCLKCGKASSYDCEECCPGLTRVVKGGYAWCQGKKPEPPTCDPATNQTRGCFFKPYKTTYLKPDQKTPGCDTGLMFPSSWDEGYGQGNDGHFMFSMVDKLQLPELDAGEYSLSWRWDCEQTPQVWNSCADVTVVA
jgi:hypothetical protein